MKMEKKTPRTPWSLFGFALMGMLAMFMLAPFVLAQAPAAPSTLPDYADTGNLLYFANTPHVWLNPAGAPSDWNKDHNWRPLALLVIAICLLANTLVYVAGRVLHQPSWERFAQAEFFQVTASAILIIGMVELLNGGFTFLQHSPLLPLGTTVSCPGLAPDVWQSGPMNYVRCQMSQKIAYTEKLYEQVSAINAAVEPSTTMCYYIFNVPSYCGDWDTDLHAKMEKAHYLAHKIVPLAIGLQAQYQFVGYVANNMLVIFLPLGLLLRAVPFLRGLGALLVALAIGFYIVFPLAYIMMDPNTARPDPSMLAPAPAALPACYNTFSGLVSVLTSSSLGGAGNSPAQPVGDPDALGQIVAQMQVEAFFEPLVALAVTLIFIGAITPLLGGESGELLHFVAKVM